MSMALMIGSLFGAFAGLIHAGSVFALKLRGGDAETASARRGRWTGALYFALWTAALWTLFGSYILYLWIGAVVIYLWCLPFRMPHEPRSAE